MALGVGLLIIALLPSIQSSRIRTRHAQCQNNLKQISVALRNYASAHGKYPPAYTIDEDGKPLHSWRTLILPQLGRGDIFALVDFNQPWNHPANAAARAMEADIYQCPDDFNLKGLTTYQAVLGPDALFSGSTPTELDRITDNPSETLLVIEAPTDEAVHWMSPRDLDEKLFLAFDDETQTNHGAPAINVAFADGSVRTLSLEMGKEIRQALTTIAGGETLPDDY